MDHDKPAECRKLIIYLFEIFRDRNREIQLMSPNPQQEWQHTLPHVMQMQDIPFGDNQRRRDCDTVAHTDVLVY